MNRYPASMANHLSAYGRYGDDQLVHMNGQEVAALDGIAAAFGRELTRNPHTGMKEAFNLFDILPIALSFTGIGAPAAIALSAASGAASAAVEGGNPLEGALMGGISGALGASLGGADAAAKAAEVGKVTLPTVQAAGPLGMETIATAVPEKQLAEALSKPLIGAGGEIAGQATPGMFGDTFTDIFGAGTDKQVSDALQSVWKKENLPYTFMGMQALSSLPDMFGGQETGGPEYKDIPENFPGAPRVVNPDYDPTMAAFGEQNAFSSGVNYGLPPLGYADGGSVEKGGGFNPLGLIGGVVPMIIDGFTDGNKYGSGILGMLLNKRKPWEMDRFRNDGGANSEGLANAPNKPAPTSLPPLGYAYGGPVGYRNGGSIMAARAGKGPGGKAEMPGEIPFNVQPRQRNIQPTNMGGMYAGSSPLFMSAPYTQIPLPGGQMGAPVGGGFSGMYQPDRSFEIATPPQGGQQQYNMPMSGGGMGQPQAGGKAGGSPKGGRMAAPKEAESPQINPGGMEPQGYAMGGMVDRAMEMDDRTVVKEAMAAIMGQSPNPEAAIAMFVDRFGEEALQTLMQKVGGGQQGRYIEGPGDGLSDSIPAMVDGQQPSALSTGEFVIPADAVSHLGNGDNKTGAKELYGMIDRLRQARTGSPTPPPAINQRGIMPA